MVRYLSSMMAPVSMVSFHLFTLATECSGRHDTFRYVLRGAKWSEGVLFVIMIRRRGGGRI